MKNWRSYLMPVLGLVIAAVIGCHRKATPAPAGDTLTVALSTNTIRVGDLIQLRLTSVHGTNLHLNPPELGQGKDVIVRARHDASVRLPGGRVREVLDYAITSLVTGQHILAASPGVIWTRPDGTTTQVPLPFAAFKVQSTLTTTNASLSQMRDLHDLARWPDRFPRWLLALLIAAVVVGLAAWLLRLYLAHARDVAAHAPPIPPHTAALAALQALLARGLIEQHQTETFYVELSAIARRYLEARFQLHAPEQTTEEFLRDAASAGKLSPAHQQLVTDFLEQSDLVKFARFQPGQADMRAAYAAAEKLVRETVPLAPDSASDRSAQ
jgi:hypothetical protein